MGTDVVVLLPQSQHELADGVERLFAGWDATLSRFRPESELSRLNAADGEETPVGPVLLAATEAALAAARATDGLFDPTLERNMVALGYDRSHGLIPLDAAASTAPPPPGGGWRAVEIDHRRGTVRLPRGAGLDLGGIAKGMAVDAAMLVLESAGVAAAAISAGGDLAVRGRPAHGVKWPIWLELPAGGQVVTLARGAMATSGISRRNWTQGGVARHHLIDPRIGLPAESGTWSASVVAGTCTQAEVASTVAFVRGLTDGAAFLEGLGLPGLFVTPSGERYPVAGWGADALAVPPAAAGIGS